MSWGWKYTPYGLPYVVSGVLSLAVAVPAWRRRRAPGALPFALFMFAMAEWSLGNALEMFRSDLAGKSFWAALEYLGIACVAPAWFAIGVELSGRREWLSRRNVGLLLAIPVLTQLLIWTNGYHGLVRYNIRLDTSGPFSVITKTYGPWFWVMTGYSYVLILLGTVMIARTLLGRAQPYRGQAMVFIVGAAAPWISNMLYVSGLSPIPRLDITPIAFTVTGLATTWGLFRYRLLDIVPVAWATVLESMGAGVMVVDAQGRVVDVNPAAESMTGWRPDRVMGRSVFEVLAAWPGVLEAYRDEERAGDELILEAGDGERSFEFRFSPLFGPRRDLLGRLAVINDITEQRRAQSQLVKYQRILAAMEERARLLRDLHDSLGEVLGFLCAQAQAASEQLAAGEALAAVASLDAFGAAARDAHGRVREYIRSMRREGRGQDEGPVG